MFHSIVTTIDFYYKVTIKVSIIIVTIAVYGIESSVVITLQHRIFDDMKKVGQEP